MKCACGNETELKKFSTFEYNYCSSCKKEVVGSESISDVIAKALTQTKNKSYLTVASSDDVLDSIRSDLNASVDLFSVTCTLYFIHSNALSKMTGYRIDAVFAEKGLNLTIPIPVTYFDTVTMQVVNDQS